MSHPFEEFRDTPLWRNLAEAVEELVASREIVVATAPEYVVGYLCQRLTAGRLTAPGALIYDP